MDIDLGKIRDLALEIAGITLLVEKCEGDISEQSGRSILKDKIDELSALMICEEINCVEPESEDETEDERSHGNLEDDYEISAEAEDERSHGNLEDDEYEEEQETKLLDFDWDPYENEPTDNGHNLDNDCENEDYLAETFDPELYDEDDSEECDVLEDDFVGEFDDDEIADDELLTVDEKLARVETVDLKNAFTINDVYRFRRELFGNNEYDFTDAINLVSAMKSYAEAEEYFYDDLEWDRDNDDVKDFMHIMSRYFSNK